MRGKATTDRKTVLQEAASGGSLESRTALLVPWGEIALGLVFAEGRAVQDGPADRPVQLSSSGDEDA